MPEATVVMVMMTMIAVPVVAVVAVVTTVTTMPLGAGRADRQRHCHRNGRSKSKFA
jgi:hypothetical protein